MDSRIYIFRHGITTGNAKKHLYGSSDLHLTEEGINTLKAAAAAGKYPDSNGADLYTTGMYRTEQTINCIYGDCEHQIIHNLREMDFGEYENIPVDEVESTEFFRKWFIEKEFSFPAPGGESYAGFMKRIRTGFQELLGYHRLKELSVRHNGQPAVSILIAHGGTNLAIMSQLFPDEAMPLTDWIVTPGNGYCIHIENGEAVSWEKYLVE